MQKQPRTSNLRYRYRYRRSARRPAQFSKQQIQCTRAKLPPKPEQQIEINRTVFSCIISKDFLLCRAADWSSAGRQKLCMQCSSVHRIIHPANPSAVQSWVFVFPSPPLSEPLLPSENEVLFQLRKRCQKALHE